jgi:hypothetical protein
MVEKAKERGFNGNGGSKMRSRKLALEYDIDVLWIGAEQR